MTMDELAEAAKVLAESDGANLRKMMDEQERVFRRNAAAWEAFHEEMVTEVLRQVKT